MMILTSYQGDNSDLIKEVCRMYVSAEDIVADVTYGKGVFWKKVDTSNYDFRPTDLQSGVDFKNLPYRDNEIDVLVLDPPYMHGGKSIKKSINDCYKNQNTSHESVIRLYAGAILEATRVLKKGGKIFVKSQDEIESGKQRWSHCELISLLEMFGFKTIDLFVLTQKGKPAMREQYQKTARKNHSYLIVGEFKR